MCDVEIRITRPDGVVETSPVTPDIAGSLAHDYVLPPPPGVLGTYTIEIVGLNGAVLASTTFTDGPEILDPDIAPGYVAGSGVRNFTVLVRNTGDTVHRCVRVTLPGGASGYSAISASTPVTSGSGTWTAGVSGQVVTFTNTVVPGLAGGGAGWLRADIQATAPAANTADWQLQAWSNTGCGGSGSNPTAVELVQVIAGAQPADRRYTAEFVDSGGTAITPPPSFAPATSATLRIKVTKSNDGQSNKIEYLGIAVPRCFTGLSVSSAGANSSNSSAWNATVVDNFIRWRDGSSGELDDGHSVTIVFNANTASCSTGSHSFSTIGWQDSNGSSEDATKLFTASAHPTMTVAPANTAPVAVRRRAIRRTRTRRSTSFRPASW